ncbi:hypothetical protein AYO41_03460 [Verrucomicrobia bacterium SCGC AG-212-E04]|nr:hypothetical protein AYO41_03460 [Verrucomicrobia bacterium SCGC AG-212-E04]
MKTLTQVEPRTPISSLPFTISSSGSYYLTQNLSVATGDGITVTADQVTLDLNGFVISSTANPASGYGIAMTNPNGPTDVTILNGRIKGSVTYSGGSYSGAGFANGIASFINASSLRVCGVSVSGCSGDGIHIPGTNTIVESCTVSTVGGEGIQAATICRSSAAQCGQVAIYANQTASDCVAQSTGSSSTLSARTATNCSATNSGPGIALDVQFASSCYGDSISGEAIFAKSVINCGGFSSSNKGISAVSVMNCYGSSALNRGISADIVIGSTGNSNGGSFGINAAKLANTSVGTSATGTGLATNIAIGCIGTNNSGPSISFINKYNMP